VTRSGDRPIVQLVLFRRAQLLQLLNRIPQIFVHAGTIAAENVSAGVPKQLINDCVRHSGSQQSRCKGVAAVVDSKWWIYVSCSQRIVPSGFDASNVLGWILGIKKHVFRLTIGWMKAGGIVEQKGNITIGIKTWAQIIQENKARLQFFQEKLEHQADQGIALSYLQEKYEAFLSGVITEEPGPPEAEEEG